jgi:hypothetical protein
LSDPKELEEQLQSLYMPWHNHKQKTHQISRGVVYLGYFGLFGELTARRQIWRWKKQGLPRATWGKGLFCSQSFQEKALDATLADLKDCVVLSTTPSYYSQFQAGCLLKQRGFQLLEGLCYKHPGYSPVSSYPKEHPGIPDRYLHWEHIWWKVIGQPTEIGLPNKTDPGQRVSVNNCGVDVVMGLEGIKAHDSNARKNILTVAFLPRGVLFPKGWKPFFSAQDYKLGVNFDSDALKNVQKCPHQFDLKIFNGWEPDFENWSPS